MLRKNWMRKLSNGALSCMAAMALMVTAGAVNYSCCWFFGQDKMPENSKKFRRF